MAWLRPVDNVRLHGGFEIRMIEHALGTTKLVPTLLIYHEILVDWTWTSCLSISRGSFGTVAVDFYTFMKTQCPQRRTHTVSDEVVPSQFSPTPSTLMLNNY